MPRPRAAAEEISSRVALHLSPSLSAAWETVLGPWFDAVSAKAARSREPIAVVTPSPSYANLVRNSLLEHGVSLLAVKFLTPAKLRERLFQEIEMRAPLREHLRLLLSIAANEGMQLPADRPARDERMNEPDFLAAKSVARAPDDFLRMLDQLGAAGWDFAEQGTPILRPVVERFHRQVRACGFELIHEADRLALKKLVDQSPRFADLLITGFNSAHWPLWPLLRAAVSSARQATVLLDYPREQARAIDETWIGTWEEVFGGATPAADGSVEPARPFSNYVRSVAPKDRSTQTLPVFVGINTTEQAQAIVAATLKFLQEESCARLGILFPRAGALSRLVSARLNDIGVPHHDGVAHLAPGDYEEPALNAWFELQESQQLTSLIRFLSALPTAAEFFGGLSIEKVSERLQRAYREVLIDDITVLREHCARRTDRKELVEIAGRLALLKFLPPRTAFSRFLSETKSAFAQFKWKDAWSEVDRLSQNWSGAVRAEFPRAIYLRWLKEILNSFSVTRDDNGNHPYARVQLLSYVDAEGHGWSHLILAGMNQGEWPRNETESGFLREEDVDLLNKRAIRQGQQGEGHWTMAEGKTLLLGPAQQRQLAVRRFVSAVESTGVGLAATASLLHESAPERLWNPSEFLSQLYFSAHGQVLSQQRMSILRAQTRAWLDEQQLLENVDTNVADVAQTRTAYDARRRNEPAGEYEFALREPIGRAIALRATEWDKVTKSPALIWMRTFLGVENSERDFNEWSAATGDWAHRWLAQISTAPAQNVFVDLVESEQARERVRHAARRLRDEIVDLCFACGRTAPDWWLSGWSNALALADCLALKVGEVKEWPRMAAEWILDSPQIISLGPDEQLRFRGRIDLILARNGGGESKLGPADIWIVDYKTGNTKSLVAPSWKTPEARLAGVRKRLVKGEAVQLGLYALAACELGAKDIGVSLLSPRLDLDQPQLHHVDLAAPADFWSALHDMQESGIFGMLGPVRSEFSFASAYPLATLPIDEELLQEKWALSHPALVDDEEDWS
jgi:hypothetical protein